MQPPRIQLTGVTVDDGPDIHRFAALDLDLGPGLHWIVGDEGTGKTTLLRLLAGRLAPRTGRVTRSFEAPVWWNDVLRPEYDGTPARDWLRQRRDACTATWREDAQAAAVESLGLAPHLDKPLHQLSAGSRRKVGLAAAIACGSPAVALDQPFAALDAASVRVLEQVLCEVAQAPDRLWIVADYAPTPRCPATSVVDLDRLARCLPEGGSPDSTRQG